MEKRMGRRSTDDKQISRNIFLVMPFDRHDPAGTSSPIKKGMAKGVHSTPSSSPG